MSKSVAARMRQYHQAQKKQQTGDQLEEIEQMTLQDLAKETITFGQAHRGENFAEVFQNHSWVDWFTSCYEKSTKPAHRKFIRYVELRLDAELDQEIPEKNYNKEKSKESPPKKASGSQEPNMDKIKVKEVDQISDEEWENMDLPTMADMQEQVSHMNQANLQLHHRVNNMEMAVQEILEHVKRLSVKTEP